MDLVATTDGNGVDHLLLVADQLGGDVDGLLCLERRHDLAGHDDGIGDRAHLDAGMGQRRTQGLAQADQVAADLDVVGGDLSPLGIEEEDIGLADRNADQEGAAGRAHDGIGDGRIGDDDVTGVTRQFDGQRLADTERDGVAGDRALLALHRALLRGRGRHRERQDGKGGQRESQVTAGHHRAAQPGEHGGLFQNGGRGAALHHHSGPWLPTTERTPWRTMAIRPSWPNSASPVPAPSPAS